MNDSQFLKEIIHTRRAFHQIPELGNSEFKTALLIEKNLRLLRIPFRRLTPTGIVAILVGTGARSKKCLALRADIDALPLTEKKSKSYNSKHPGRMHACGHDAHIAMLLGAASLLSKDKSFSGTVKLMFQPNEEGAGGAKLLIQKGAMKNPAVQAVFGLHVNPRLASGKIGLKKGPLMAAVDRFKIEVIGEGGHAAYPHEGNDAILIASEIVQSLQSIVSRKVDPVEPAVVTVGTINSGTQYNILAGRATLTGTVRTLSEKLHAQMPKMFEKIVAGICSAHGAKYELQYDILGSVLNNTPEMIDFARATVTKIFGAEKIEKLNHPSMGGEDFAEYLKHAPGAFIYIGTGNKTLKTTIPWHHPDFDLDENALIVGSKLLDSLSREYLRK